MIEKVWGGLISVWLVTMIVLPFLIGGLVLSMPLIKNWAKTVTLYDLTIVFWWYALLMAIIGSTMFTMSSEKEAGGKLISLLGIIILVALVVVKFNL